MLGQDSLIAIDVHPVPDAKRRIPEAQHNYSICKKTQYLIKVELQGWQECTKKERFYMNTQLKDWLRNTAANNNVKKSFVFDKIVIFRSSDLSSLK